MILRQLIDRNQHTLQKLNRLQPPKSERTVMEAIARRVGVEMPEAPEDRAREELAYYYEKIYVSPEKFNTEPSPDETEEENKASS